MAKCLFITEFARPVTVIEFGKVAIWADDIAEASGLAAAALEELNRAYTRKAFDYIESDADPEDWALGEPVELAPNQDDRSFPDCNTFGEEPD